MSLKHRIHDPIPRVEIIILRNYNTYVIIIVQLTMQSCKDIIMNPYYYTTPVHFTGNVILVHKSADKVQLQANICRHFLLYSLYSLLQAQNIILPMGIVLQDYYVNRYTYKVISHPSCNKGSSSSSCGT